VREGETHFNVYRSEMDILRGQGQYTQDPDRALTETYCGVLPSALPFSDSFTPPPGKMVFFMVTLTDSRQGYEGSLGVNWQNALRPNHFACPQ